jgi:TRAP-type C4-dicarboxylate transport system permease small subunit
VADWHFAGPPIESAPAFSYAPAVARDEIATGPGGSAASPIHRFADDSNLARSLRRFDGVIGRLEQALLFALLALVVITAVLSFVWDIALHSSLPHNELIIRYAVFASGMVGGAYAAHHQRLLSMDLLSKQLGPRGRAVLRVVLAIFGVVTSALLLWGGLLVYDITSAEASAELIPRSVPAIFVPIGAALIGLHLVIQSVIDLDYLRRGKLPPEPEQGAV